MFGFIFHIIFCLPLIQERTMVRSNRTNVTHKMAVFAKLYLNWNHTKNIDTFSGKKMHCFSDACSPLGIFNISIDFFHFVANY